MARNITGYIGRLHRIHQCKKVVRVYPISDEADQRDLFVSLCRGAENVTAITNTETKTAAEQCPLIDEVRRGLASTMDDSNDVYELALTIQECYGNLDQIRVYVLTDQQAKAKNF